MMDPHPNLGAVAFLTLIILGTLVDQVFVKPFCRGYNRERELQRRRAWPFAEIRLIDRTPELTEDRLARIMQRVTAELGQPGLPEEKPSRLDLIKARIWWLGFRFNFMRKLLGDSLRQSCREGRKKFRQRVDDYCNGIEAD